MPYLNATIEAEEALRRALAAGEGAVALIDIAGQQLSRVGICAGNKDCGHIQDICCQASCHQGAQELAGWHQHL